MGYILDAKQWEQTEVSGIGDSNSKNIPNGTLGTIIQKERVIKCP